MAKATRASPTAHKDRDHLECVHGNIAFARRTPDEKPPVVATSSYDVPMVSHDVTIRNARPIVDELSLDREGFTLIKHKMACASERDREIMCDKYLEEMIPFIKNYFNASSVVPLGRGVIVRSTGGAMDQGRVQSRVAGFAHVD